jgi:hypothetical protein
MLSNKDRAALRKARNKQRAARAEIHAAMCEADKMARSRKKGTSRDRDKNMAALGFVRIGENGQGLAPEEKWTKATA